MPHINGMYTKVTVMSLHNKSYVTGCKEKKWDTFKRKKITSVMNSYSQGKKDLNTISSQDNDTQLYYHINLSKVIQTKSISIYYHKIWCEVVSFIKLMPQQPTKLFCIKSVFCCWSYTNQWGTNTADLM